MAEPVINPERRCSDRTSNNIKTDAAASLLAYHQGQQGEYSSLFTFQIRIYCIYIYDVYICEETFGRAWPWRSDNERRNFGRTSPWKADGQCTKFWQDLPLEN